MTSIDAFSIFEDLHERVQTIVRECVDSCDFNAMIVLIRDLTLCFEFDGKEERSVFSQSKLQAEKAFFNHVCRCNKKMEKHNNEMQVDSAEERMQVDTMQVDANEEGMELERTQRRRSSWWCELCLPVERISPYDAFLARTVELLFRYTIDLNARGREIISKFFSSLLLRGYISARQFRLGVFAVNSKLMDLRKDTPKVAFILGDMLFQIIVDLGPSCVSMGLDNLKTNKTREERFVDTRKESNQTVKTVDQTQSHCCVNSAHSCRGSESTSTSSSTTSTSSSTTDVFAEKSDEASNEAGSLMTLLDLDVRSAYNKNLSFGQQHHFLQVKSNLVKIAKMFLDSGDEQEAIFNLYSLYSPYLHSDFVKKLVRLSMDGGTRERERVSQFLAKLTVQEALVASYAVEEAFWRLLVQLEDLSVDVPKCSEMMIRYITRSVADKVITFSFVETIINDQTSSIRPSVITAIGAATNGLNYRGGGRNKNEEERKNEKRMNDAEKNKKQDEKNKNQDSSSPRTKRRIKHIWSSAGTRTIQELEAAVEQCVRQYVIDCEIERTLHKQSSLQKSSHSHKNSTHKKSSCNTLTATLANLDAKYFSHEFAFQLVKQALRGETPEDINRTIAGLRALLNQFLVSQTTLRKGIDRAETFLENQKDNNVGKGNAILKLIRRTFDLLEDSDAEDDTDEGTDTE